MGLFASKDNPVSTGTAPSLPDLYVSDLVLGMLETHRSSVLLERDAALPFFGFLVGRPLQVTYGEVVTQMTTLIEQGMIELPGGERAGAFAVVLGQSEDALEFRFRISIGPGDDWLRLIVED